MTQKTKRIIAVIELVIVVALVAYLFLPRSFDKAMSGNFDRETVTAVQVEITGQEDGGFAIQPGTPVYEELITLLDSQKYRPYYVGDGPKIAALPRQTELTFSAPDGEYTISFCANETIAFSGSDVRLRSFRVSGDGVFQQELEELLTASSTKENSL